MKYFLISVFFLWGYLSQAQTITIDFDADAEKLLEVSPTSVTGSGTFTFGFVPVTTDDRQFLANLSSGSVPTFRGIDASDLPVANSSIQAGIVSTISQTFGGLKTFNDGLNFPNTITGRILSQYNSNPFIRSGGGFDESLFIGPGAGSDGGSLTGAVTLNGNTGIGAYTLSSLVNPGTGSPPGNHNTAIGWYSLSSATRDKNTMIGSRGGQSFTTGEMNTGIGWNVFYTGSGGAITGSNNIGIGPEVGTALTSGSNNIFIGTLAGSSVTTGSGNIYIGGNITGTSGATDLINIGDAWYGDITDQTLGIGVSDPEATLHLKAGTATANTAPIRFNPGTVLTTAEAGAIEYDGKAFYSSVYLSGTDVGTRGVSPSVNFTCNTADVSMTSGTGSQSVFDPSRDAFTVSANTTYYFEAQYVITGMGSATKGIKTLFGGSATISSINYSVLSWGSTGSIESDQRSINVNVATATPTVHPNMFSESVLQLKGIIRIGGSGGTVTPQIQFSAAPGGSIKGAENSYFLIYALGDDTVGSVGAWN